MKTITIKKFTLKEKLGENLKKHDAVYKEAVENYWKDVKERFQDEVNDINEMIEERDISNGGIRISVYIDAPVSQRLEYENALSMLEYEVNDNVELTQNEFNSYVLNQWNWSDQFLASNAMYASSGTLQAFSGQV